ncbi:MAG: hydrolase [Myxococcales bacterium]|nr:hydrolase [Myxococcales bacterium]
MTSANPLHLRAGDAALIVIDIQERLIAAMPDKVRPALLRNTAILIAAARALGVPIVVSEQYPKGLGPTVPEIAGTLGDAAPIDKTAFSALGEPRFKDALERTGRRQAIVVGIEAHVCVFQTVVDLVEAGYGVFVPADAVASRTKENWKIAQGLVTGAGAHVTSTEAVAFQLVERAGTEPFKLVSKLVR